MKIEYIIIVICILLAGCKKDNPPVGRYMGTFSYSSPSGMIKQSYLSIGESNKNTLTINGSELLKDGKKISGQFIISTIGLLEIEGKWSKKIFSNSYIIKGDFTQYNYIGGIAYPYFGTFIIESDF